MGVGGGMVIFLAGLGIYLVVLPLLGLAVSAKAELIIRQGRRRRQQDEERLRLARETHRLLDHVHAAAATQLGHQS